MHLSLTTHLPKPQVHDLTTVYQITLWTKSTENDIAIVRVLLALIFLGFLGFMLFKILKFSTALAVGTYRNLLSTRIGQAIQTRLHALLVKARGKLDDVLAPVRARLDILLAPARARWDVVFAYFLRMSRLLVARRFGPIPPPPGLDRDTAVFLLWVVPPAVLQYVVALAPFALLAWVVRRLRSTANQAVDSRRRRRSSPKTDVVRFRFLDLPPELRNRVYAFAAETAFETSAKVAYKSPRDCRFDLARKTPQEVLVNLLRLSERAWETKPMHRLALPCANRQIYNEVSRLYWQDMRLDFEFCDLRSSLPQLSKFTDIFGKTAKLQFVRKLEMPLGVAKSFLFASPHEDNASLSPQTDTEFVKIRSRLLDVQQVTIYPDHKGATVLEDVWDLADRRAVGFNVVYQLADPNTRVWLAWTFPHLEDIVAKNKFGSERFRRAEGGLWQVWYSKQMMPAQRRDWDDVMLAMPGMLFDAKTRLTAPGALGWISL